MKKSRTFFLTLFVTTLFLGGCMKNGNYTCICTDEDGYQEEFILEDQTKANARITCKAMDMAGSKEFECKLK